MTAAAPPARPTHPLLRFFLDSADGSFPPADGGVTLHGPLPGGLECSVAFTGHAVVATALPAEEIRRFEPDGFGASLAPDLLRHLAGPEGMCGEVDVTLTARGTGAADGAEGTPRLPARIGLEDHPRVRHARALRTRVRTYANGRGIVTLAEGLAGRRELSCELLTPQGAGSEHGRRHGRRLLKEALRLVPEGEPVFAAVSPSNARSLRAFLAAGFTPVGSEVVVRPAGRGLRDTLHTRDPGLDRTALRQRPVLRPGS